MSKKNLEILVHFLETKVLGKLDDHFNMISIALSRNGPIDVDHLDACGTTACMLGWATQAPELREQGLKLYKLGNSDMATIVHFHRGIASFFGLTAIECDWLFYSWDNRPDDLAYQIDRCRFLLDGGTIRLNTNGEFERVPPL